MKRRKSWQTEESLKKWKQEQAARKWKDPRKMDKSLIPDPDKFYLDVWVGYVMGSIVVLSMLCIPVIVAYDTFIFYRTGQSSGVFDGFPSNAGRR